MVAVIRAIIYKIYWSNGENCDIMVLSNSGQVPGFSVRAVTRGTNAQPEKTGEPQKQKKSEETTMLDAFGSLIANISNIMYSYLLIIMLLVVFGALGGVMGRAITGIFTLFCRIVGL